MRLHAPARNPLLGKPHRQHTARQRWGVCLNPRRLSRSDRKERQLASREALQRRRPGAIRRVLIGVDRQECLSYLAARYDRPKVRQAFLPVVVA